MRAVLCGPSQAEAGPGDMGQTTPLTTSEWAQIGTAIKFLWLALGCALVAGSTLMTAHAFIPSAVATRTIPQKFEKLRMPLYAAGVLAAVGLFAMLALAAVNADDIVRRLHPRYWQ